jgi:prevent-host-death family protein
MRQVKIAQLKDHLSEHLRAVEAGEEVVVTDRNRPIARIVPATAGTHGVRLIAPRYDFAKVRDRVRQRVDLGVSSTALLMEERGDR